MIGAVALLMESLPPLAAQPVAAQSLVLDQRIELPSIQGRIVQPEFRNRFSK